MTDQGAMLKLARAVYPDAVVEAEGGVVFVYGKRHREYFDPNVHDYQFVDVLCWTLNQDKCNDVDGHAVRVYIDGAQQATTVEHDNTPASFRAAVTKAALRVVQG